MAEIHTVTPRPEFQNATCGVCALIPLLMALRVIYCSAILLQRLGNSGHDADIAKLSRMTHFGHWIPIRTLG